MNLLGSLNISGVVKGYLGDVYVIAQLREKLTKPEIRFKLDFPQGSPVKTDNDFSQFLARLEKDQNEILKQVAFLIALNTFAPPDASSVGSNNPYLIGTLFGTTISQVLSKVINNLVTNLLYKITGDRRLRLDVGTSVYSSSTLISGADAAIVNGGPSRGIDRTRFDMKLGYAFAKDKIIVTLGGDLDFGLGNTTAAISNTTQWLPNLNIEFILSKDKKLRLIVFNKTTLDVSFGKRQRQGVSISYRKDFEKLFGSKNSDVVYKEAPVDKVGKKEN